MREKRDEITERVKSAKNPLNKTHLTPYEFEEHMLGSWEEQLC